MLMVLGGLGSHDLSAMRETLGKPVSILGASLGFPFWKRVLLVEHSYNLTNISQCSLPISRLRSIL